MATTIDDLRKAGYTVGVAWGGVEAELVAHETAVEETSPTLLLEQTQSVVSSTLADIRSRGQALPPGQTWADVAGMIASQAYRHLEEGANERVAMHKSAIEIATGMPTVYHVSGHGFGGYVSIDDATGSGSDEAAQAELDRLVDKDAIATREFDLNAPRDLRLAVGELRAAGAEVEHAHLRGKKFSVKVKGSAAATSLTAVKALRAKLTG